MIKGKRNPPGNVSTTCSFPPSALHLCFKSRSEDLQAVPEQGWEQRAHSGRRNNVWMPALRSEVMTDGTRAHGLPSRLLSHKLLSSELHQLILFKEPSFVHHNDVWGQFPKSSSYWIPRECNGRGPYITQASLCTQSSPCLLLDNRLGTQVRCHTRHKHCSASAWSLSSLLLPTVVRGHVLQMVQERRGGASASLAREWPWEPELSANWLRWTVSKKPLLC